MERASLETSVLVYCICDSGRIYHGNTGEQVDAVAGMGLLRSALSALWTDMRSVYDFVFRLVCGGNFSGACLAALVVRQGKAGVSCDYPLKSDLKFAMIVEEIQSAWQKKNTQKA